MSSAEGSGTVLVTGAAGFVGSHVCDALLGALVDAKFLTHTRDGAYVRRDGARPTALHVSRGHRMAVA